MQTKEENQNTKDSTVIRITRIKSSENLDKKETFGAIEEPHKPKGMTRCFTLKFGEHAVLIGQKLVELLKDEVKTKGPIDYIQQFQIEKNGLTSEVWVVDNGHKITIMVPADY